MTIPLPFVYNIKSILINSRGYFEDYSKVRYMIYIGGGY